MLGLTPEQMLPRSAVAGTQAAGHTEQLGSMTKALHPGRRRRRAEAALLAQYRPDARPTGRSEGPRGMAALMSPDLDVDGALAGLGERWELEPMPSSPTAAAS